MCIIWTQRPSSIVKNSAKEQSIFFFFEAVFTAHWKSFSVTKSGRRITEIQLNVDLSECAKKIEAPTLLIWGEEDVDAPLEDAKKLEEGNLILDFDGITYNIDNSFILKDICSKDGYAAVMINYKKVAINTVLTQDLINEGLAREIVSKVQNLRKTSGFDIADRIVMTYSAGKEIKDAISAYKKYIMDEVLAVKLTESKTAKEELNINDYDMKVSIKRVK